MNAQKDRKPPEITPRRKALYYAGLGLMVLGALLCVIGFITFASGGMSAVNGFGFMPETGVQRGFLMFLLGMLSLIAGSILRVIGARGAAGSGLVLDPEKARDDLHPFTRMAGGMVKDAADAFRGDQPAARETIKVRCPNCRALNDESDKFCGQCGREL